MIVSEQRTEAETWLSQVDGMTFGMDRSERLSVQHAAYSAAAIAIMNTYNTPTYGDAWKDSLRPKDGFVYRLGQRHETPPIKADGYQPSVVTVGVARDTDIRILPSFLGGEHSVVTREEFYIRNLSVFTSGSDPDITCKDWSIPSSAYRLPSKHDVGRDIYRDDVARFGREIAHLAFAKGVGLPTTFEEIQDAKLKADL
jgi:hypothetical protein